MDGGFRGQFAECERRIAGAPPPPLPARGDSGAADCVTLRGEATLQRARALTLGGFCWTRLSERAPDPDLRVVGFWSPTAVPDDFEAVSVTTLRRVDGDRYAVTTGVFDPSVVVVRLTRVEGAPTAVAVVVLPGRDARAATRA